MAKKQRMPDYIGRARKDQSGAGKGDRQRPMSDAFADNFDVAFSNGEAAVEDTDPEPGPVGHYAREIVAGPDGTRGPRYLMDPGSLLRFIDDVEALDA